MRHMNLEVNSWSLVAQGWPVTLDKGLSIELEENLFGDVFSKK